MNDKIVNVTKGKRGFQKTIRRESSAPLNKNRVEKLKEARDDVLASLMDGEDIGANAAGKIASLWPDGKNLKAIAEDPWSSDWEPTELLVEIAELRAKHVDDTSNTLFHGLEMYADNEEIRRSL